MKTEMKTENLSNIHVFRVNRVTAKVREPSSQPAIIKVNSRTRLSAETKRLICEDHIKNPKATQEALALKYGCKRTTVAKIIKSKDRWLSINSDDIIAKRFRQRNSRYPLVENSLMSWLQKEHSDISLVTDQMLRSQARQYAQEYHVDGLEDFKASSSWVANFKQRYMTPKSSNTETAPPTLLLENNVNTMSTSDIPNKTPSDNSVNHKTPVLPTAESSGSEAASSAFVENTTIINPSEATKLVVGVSLLPTDLNSGNIITSGLEQSTIETDCGTDKEYFVTPMNDMMDEDDMMEVDIMDDSIMENSKMKDGIVKENVMDDGIMADDTMDGTDDGTDDYGDQDYGDQDYGDDYDDVELPCFVEIENIASTTLDNNDTHEEPSRQDKNSNIEVKTTEKGAMETSNVEPDTTSQESTKLSAKQHLEAALAFYTSQNEGNNQSMSANMIKLILQNDF